MREADADHEGFADLLILEEFFGFLGAGEHAVGESDHEFFACFFCRGNHSVGVFERGSDWFFAEDVASRVERGDGIFRVEDVGRADADDIEVFVLQHVFVIRIARDFAEALLNFIMAFGRGFCEGYHFAAAVFFVSREVAFLGDGACADDADFVGFFGGAHVSLDSWGCELG